MDLAIELAGMIEKSRRESKFYRPELNYKVLYKHVIPYLDNVLYAVRYGIDEAVFRQNDRDERLNYLVELI